MFSHSSLLSLSIAIVLAHLSASALANDTEAAFGAGGLVFKKSTDVELLSEELSISLEQIVVNYRFRNSAAEELTTVVAFPLPAIKYDESDPDNEYGFSFDRFHGFTTTVDTTPVQTRIEEKAMLGGRDETLTLNNLGIALDPWAAHAALAHTEETIADKLRDLSLIDDRDNPRWSLIRTYYWTQTLPAGKDIEIEHRYRPMVGGSVATGLDVFAHPSDQRESYKKFCVDKPFLNAVKRRATAQRTPDGSFVEGWYENWIEYVLKTGANWSGPIRKFRLVVDKGRTDNLVSFCGEGVRKIGPTLFEVTYTNFVPKEDLFVLVLTPSQSAEMPNESVEGLADLSCEELWIRRNSIYKAGGYCFKTSRAVSYFGNSGCSVNDIARVRLSKADRALIRQISSFENKKRCGR